MVARRWQHLPHHVEDADMSRKLLLTSVASVSEGERLEALARATAAEIERMTAEEQAKVPERCAYLLPKDGSPDQAIDLPKAIELQKTIDAKFDVVPVVAPVDQATIAFLDLHCDRYCAIRTELRSDRRQDSCQAVKVHPVFLGERLIVQVQPKTFGGGRRGQADCPNLPVLVQHYPADSQPLAADHG
jgi:hypothetical protein